MTPAPSIMFIGDIVGSAGRSTLLHLLPRLRDQYKPTFVVVNGENAAGGLGITPEIADEFLDAGVDVITLGNHTYDRDEIRPYLDSQPRILRPSNYSDSDPGRGVTVVERDGLRLGVVNLMGNGCLGANQPLFPAADAAVAELRDQADYVLVDIHAELTLEKVALGWYLDGRVTAVVGTHTHVPTADASVLPGGTAYISDVGMTGGSDGVIGISRALVIDALAHQTELPFFTEAYTTCEGDPWLMGVLVRCAQAPRAATIEPLRVPGLPDRG